MARKGLPAKYIRQANGDLKKAWRLYRRKRGGSSRSRSRTRTRKSRTSRSKRSMKRKPHILPWLPAIVLGGDVLTGALDGLQSGGLIGAAEEGLNAIPANILGTGLVGSGKGVPKGDPALFWASVIVGVGGSIAASKLGLNRRLGRAKVPVLM